MIKLYKDHTKFHKKHTNEHKIVAITHLVRDEYESIKESIAEIENFRYITPTYLWQRMGKYFVIVSKDMTTTELDKNEYIINNVEMSEHRPWTKKPER